VQNLPDIQEFQLSLQLHYHQDNFFPGQYGYIDQYIKNLNPGPHPGFRTEKRYNSRYLNTEEPGKKEFLWLNG
jgi:hypothetical protein